MAAVSYLLDTTILLHWTRGTPQPHAADATSPVYSAHERILKEADQPRSDRGGVHAWYNFYRVHQALRVTPAMQAGLTDHVWTIRKIVGVAD